MYFVTYGLIFAALAFLGLHFGRVESIWLKAALSFIAFLLFGLFGWLVMPTLAWNFFGNWAFLAIIGVFILLLSGMVTSKVPPFIVWTPLLVGASMLMVVAFVMSVSIFHARNYHSLIGEPVTSQFVDDVSPVDIKQVRVVDRPFARQLGEKRLGEIAGLGSRVNLGTMNIFTVDGCFNILDGRDTEHTLCFEDQLVWAGPLVHSGFWKWSANDSTPGYILVSATDRSKAYLVTAISSSEESVETSDVARMGEEEAAGEFDGLEMRYFFTGGFWGEYALRHMRTSGYMSAGLTDYSFELNDGGQPYWVVTRFIKRVGFLGEDAIGVVTIDIQSGAIKEYSIDDVPKWIDRIQPEDFVTEQLDDWGEYGKGWLNAVFTKTGVVKTTPGMSLVHGADDESYWYTGIQSAGADEATTGFVLVNTRTKEFRWYQVSGAKETSAKGSAENAPGVREAQYQATSPILYNVGGVPTYFMTLKGDDGLVKMYAFVSVQNYETFGVGNSVPNALRNYRDALVQQDRGLTVDDLVQRQRIEVTVIHIATEEGFYYLLLEGQEGKEFTGSSAVSPELKWTEPGSRVAVEFDEGSGNPIAIVNFDNLDIDITGTE